MLLINCIKSIFCCQSAESPTQTQVKTKIETVARPVLKNQTMIGGNVSATAANGEIVPTIRIDSPKGSSSQTAYYTCKRPQDPDFLEDPIAKKYAERQSMKETNASSKSNTEVYSRAADVRHQDFETAEYLSELGSLAYNEKFWNSIDKQIISDQERSTYALGQETKQSTEDLRPSADAGPLPHFNEQ